MRDSQEIFYFLHIPKTAGNTFCFSVLPSLFDWAVTCPAHDYPELLPIPPAELSKYRLFRGHFYYFFRRLLPVEPVMFTFLRDPVERVLSLYDHIRRDERHYQHEAVLALKNGVADAIRSQWLLPANFQVSALTCDLDPVETMAAERARHPNGFDEYSAIYTEMTRRPPTRSDLALARKRLEDMPFVGISEEFDQSVRLFCDTLGRPVPAYESMNIAPSRTSRESLPPEVLAEVKKANELDFELYEFARSLFRKRVATARLDAVSERA